MNLWTDLDDNDSIPAEVKERKRSSRGLTERTTLSTIRDWLLRDYVASYCRSLGATRIFRRCYWIDGLGIDTRSDPPAQGDIESLPVKQNGRRPKQAVEQTDVPALRPVIEIAQALAQGNRPITLYGQLLIPGHSKRKVVNPPRNDTTTATKAFNISKENGIVHGSWPEVAAALLERIEQAPAIFLLNPFSSIMFNHKDLAPLYQRTVPTELLFLVSHKQIEAHLSKAQRSPAQGTQLTGLLRSDRWKALPTGEGEQEQACEKLIEMFIASIQRHFLLPIQRIALPMQVGSALIKMVPYTLIFATRRQDSLATMNDALYSYCRRVYRQSYQGVLGEEWFMQQQEERYQAELQQLYELAKQQGQAQHIRRWPDLRQQLLQGHLGQYSMRDYDTIIQKLLHNGEVRCDWKQHSTESDTRRIPASDDILRWH